MWITTTEASTAVLEWNGATWTNRTDATSRFWMDAAHTTAAGVSYFGGDDGIVRWTDAGMESVSGPRWVTSICSTSATDLWAVGYGAILCSDPTGRFVAQTSPTTVPPRRAGGRGPRPGRTAQALLIRGFDWVGAQLGLRERAMKLLVLAPALLTCLACGLNPLHEPESPPAAPQVAEPASAPAAQSTPKGRPLAELQAEFTARCLEEVPNGNAYCECSWSSKTKVFSPEELSSSREPMSAQTEALAVLMVICRRELPEATVKATFTEECRNDKPELKAYCDCAWTTTRKRQTVAEIANGVGLGPKGKLMKECVGTISEATVKKAFMSVCRENDKNDASECTCIWTQVRAIASPGQVALGAIDRSRLETRVVQHCPTATL